MRSFVRGLSVLAIVVSLTLSPAALAASRAAAAPDTGWWSAAVDLAGLVGNLLHNLSAASGGDAGGGMDPNGVAGGSDAGGGMDPNGLTGDPDAGGGMDPNG